MQNSLSPNQRYQIYQRVIGLLRDDNLYVDEDQDKVKWYGKTHERVPTDDPSNPTHYTGVKSALEVIVDDLVYGITDFVVSAFSTSSYLISAFGSVELGQLSDVYLQNLKKNDGLKYDGSKWINYTISASPIPNLSQLSDVQLGGLTIDDNLKWNGTKWVNYTITNDYLTSSDLVNKYLELDQNNNPQSIINGAPKFEGIDFDTTSPLASSEGRLKWNNNGNAEITLSGGNVTNQIGFDVNLKVYNSTGSNIPNATVVRIIGNSSDNNILDIELANAYRDNFDKINSVYATTTQSINNGNIGYVTLVGNVDNVDTSYMGIGETLYVDPSYPGLITTSKPEYPDLTIIVGHVVKTGINGTIFVKHNVNSDLYPYIATKDPTGFKEPENVIVTYSEANRTITLTGTVEAYWQGHIVNNLISGWVSDPHPTNPTSPYYLYYDGTGFYWNTTSPEDYNLMISSVHFSPNGIFRFGVRECRGTMPWSVHKNLHDNIGAYVKSGGDLSNYTLNSTTPANRRPYVSSTTFIDEDIQTINAVLNTNAYSTYNLSASSGEVVILDDRTDIVPLNGSRPYYNQFTGGSWVQTLMTSGSYMNVWLYTIPTTADTKSQKRRFLWIQGQQEGTLADMQSRTSNNINLGVLGNLNAESIFIGKIIIQYTASDWKIVEVTKLTGNKISQSDSSSGNFLSSVTTDGTTILGNGTAGSPLSFNMSLLSATSLSATGLTGNGTANYFPIYNGIGVTLTNSLMRQNSGSIGIDGTPTQKLHVFAGNITTENNYGYVLRNSSNAYKYLAKYNTGSDILDISETGIKSRFQGSIEVNGGSLIVLQNAQNGGSTRGLALWTAADTSWALYMATAGVSSSFGNGAAPSSLSGRTGHHIRFRSGNNNAVGFIWENSSETCLMSLDGDTGTLSTKNINVFAGNITTENNYGYVLRNGSNAYKYLAKYGTGSDILDISETGITSRFQGNVTINGGSFITVQGGVDGGNARGIALWAYNSYDWAIYMATAGASKSFNNGTSPSSHSGRTGHHIRFRSGNQNTHGFIWENSAETCLMSLDGDTGELYTKNINVIQGSTIFATSTTSDDLLAQNSGLVVYQYNVGNASDRNYSSFMTFHRGGYWAEQFGLDTNNKFYHGGWSRSNKYYFFTEYNKPNASNITAGTFGTGAYTFIDSSAPITLRTAATNDNYFSFNPSTGLIATGRNGTATLGGIALGVNDVAALTIKSTGLVGINTTSPVYPLDIELNVGNTNAKFGASKGVYVISDSPTIGFNAYFNTAWKFGKGSSTSYASIIGMSPVTGLMSIYNSSTAGNADGAITFNTGLHFTKDGRFGVANSQPSYLLDVYSSSDTYQTVARLHNNLPSWATIVNKGTELLFSGGVGEYRPMVSVGAQWSANSDGGKSDFVLKVRSAEALVETMRVRHNGNTSLLTNLRVGSMSIPNYTVHVNGNIALNTVNGLYFLDSSTERWRIYGVNGSCGTLTDLSFYSPSSSKEALALTSTGDVNIPHNVNAYGILSLNKTGMNDWAEIQFESFSGSGSDDGVLYFSLYDNNNEKFVWRYKNSSNPYVTLMTLEPTGLTTGHIYASGMTTTGWISINGDITTNSDFYCNGTATIGTNTFLSDAYSFTSGYLKIGAASIASCALDVTGDVRWTGTILAGTVPVGRLGVGTMASGTYVYPSATKIRFTHPNESSTDDGTISSGVYGEGLCIVGTQTVAAGGRKIGYWGKLIDRQSQGATFNGNVDINATLFAAYSNILNLDVDYNITCDNITIGTYPVMRWRGKLSSDPSGARNGDMYWNTSVVKLKVYDGGWITEF